MGPRARAIDAPSGWFFPAGTRGPEPKPNLTQGMMGDAVFPKPGEADEKRAWGEPQ